MFDANHRGRAAIVATLNASYATNLRAIESERGITLPDIRAVYTYPTDSTPKGANIAFPCAEVLPPSGPIEATSASSVSSELAFWVHVNAQTPSAEQADEQLDGYLTALVRTLGLVEYGDMTLTVTTLDTSQPAPTDSGFVQAVAVLVTVYASE